MKKLLTLVVVLLFASTAFAQSSTRQVDTKVSQEILEQMAKDIKSGDMKARGMNNLLYNKRKELGALKSDRAQIPHGPSDNDVVVYSEDFDGPSTVWYGYNLGSSSGGVVDTTSFNAFGDVSNRVWWFGTNDPSFLQPGYGASWGVYLQHTKVSYQLQSGLTSASIDFDGFYNIEPGWDAVHLLVSVDSGATWDWFDCWSGDTGGEWVDVSVDVSDYIGEFITFRFVLISDGGFDSEDGEIGSFDNPGGFFFDNLQVVRNGVAELVTDGGNSRFNMFSGAYAPNFYWSLTDEESASEDTSLAYAVGESYDPGSVYFAGVDVNLDPVATLGGNHAAPIWFDFNVYSTMPSSLEGGEFDYWAPYLINWSTSPVSVVGLSEFVYTGAFGEDGDFVAYSDNFGYIDLSSFIGDFVTLGILFAANGGCDFGDGELYVDDFEIIQKNDPYEFNDYCDTASLVEYGFMSEFANTFTSTDVDYYYFEGEEGDWVDVYVDNSNTDMYLYLLAAADNETCLGPMEAGRVCCPMYSYDDGELYDRVIWRLPYTGGYFIETASSLGDTASYTLYLDKLESGAEITSVTDVDNDQGKMVTVEFTAPELDNYEDADFSKWGAQTQSFQIERRANLITSNIDIVGQVEAFGLSPDGQAYRVDVPTTRDSVSQYFAVRAKNGFVDYQGVSTELGAEVSGQSADNIAPVIDHEYTATAESGTGIDVGAEVDYGGGNNGISDLAFYNIYRGESAGFTPSNDNLIATVETNATSVRYNDTEWADQEWYYVIEVVDDGGNNVYSKEVNTITGVSDEAIPTVYSLAQNYPNPFNPATTIKFGLPQASDVTIKIYDILGQEVKTLINRNMTAGFHTVNFDASSLISGMYIYRIQATGSEGADFTDVKKMLLVK